MVTHTWHSRFRDLVASVVAEALQAEALQAEMAGDGGDGWEVTSKNAGFDGHFMGNS